ncbi:MAG: hypothetical protein JNK49_21190 [Planctomycetes bacterium]|nr:hypothetical protein [Planctomycetota bacterium]
MSDTKPTLPISPQDLVTTGLGFALGIGMIGGFILLAKTLGLALLVNHGNVPHQ